MKKRAANAWRHGVRFLKDATETIHLGALISKNLYTGEVSTLAPPLTHVRNYAAGRVEVFRTKGQAEDFAAKFPKDEVECFDLKVEEVHRGSR